ncbi:MAG TPA: YciI family protein [Chloroflexota bacterium]|nr:YciI family protein [Chloroflexota bacterium]
MAWFLAQRRAVKPREEWTVSLDRHLAWMKEQHEAGTIALSGPTPDRKIGMYLIRAKDRAEAERIAAGDPYTAAGFTTFDLIEWEIHQILGAGAFSAQGLGH